MSAFTRFIAILSLFLAFIPHCYSLGSTDTLTWGGSNDRTGYEENHNMDPAVVSSEQFGMLFRTALPGRTSNGWPEQIFASPLVYTASDGVQYVYIATAMNNVYKINAKDGTIVASRNLARPFLQTDLETCTDINPVIGSTATGVIDPATGTWYLTTKTYVDQSAGGASGKPNGRYLIHAISTDDLSARPNYPVDIEYTVARNNPQRWFTAGIHHQRPGLLQFNNFIYIGFASHCIQYNYTGWIMGLQKDSGDLVEAYTMEGAGVGPQTSGAGIWMSGAGLSSNGVDSIYWSSGNGGAYQLDQSPVNGRQPPTALEEAAIHAIVNPDGTIKPIDFFMPWEKRQLDGADKDLGTSPLQLLPSQFSCGSVQRIGMVTGKSGKTYWLNLDDMGGYRNGENRLDNIIQSYQHENSVYAGAAVYPLEGGYVYINVINYPTRVFKFTCQGGVPYFNPVATTTEVNAGRLSVGHGTVTSLGQPGTGLLWVSDMDGSSLRIYNPIPDASGKMTLLNSFATPGVTKFSKLSFGDGVVYQITSSGWLYAYGSPINLPLTCSPVEFPVTNLSSVSDPQTIQCQAKTDLTVTASSSPANFQVQMPTFPLTVAAGTNFSFQATFAPKIVGSLSSSIFLNTTQATSGYTTTTQVQLKGKSQSQNPVLAINPPVVTWNGVIMGDSVNQTVIFSNLGNAVLNITSVKYSIEGETGPWITPNGTGPSTSIGPFTFYNVPTTIAPQSTFTVPINFNPSEAGGYAVYVRVESNGGNAIFDTFATGAELPKALLEFETLNGTWTPYDNNTAFGFGDVVAGTTRTLRLRLTNNGGPNAAPLSVTVSKPPFGIPDSVLGASNGVDLGEGQLINSGSSKTANMFCAPPKSQINQPSYSNSTTWTMNLNDPAFGHQLIRFTCNVVTTQSGPVSSNGTTLYQYAGCYKESNPGRQLQAQIYSSPNNTNDMCISQCSAAGYIFAGTQYREQCWCGNVRPRTVVDEANCYWDCSGDASQTCGGDGIERAGSYLSVFGDMSRWDGNTTNDPGPWTNSGTNGFTSIGCWTDNGASRTLKTQKYSDNDTVATCLQACQGYQYAGVEYGGECYCDDTLNTDAQQAPLTDCSYPCNNNATEYCGGSSRLNVYQFGLNTSTPALSNSTSTTTSTTSTSSISTTIYNTTTTISNTTSNATASSTTVSTTTSARYPAVSTSSSDSTSSTSGATSPSSSSTTTTTTTTTVLGQNVLPTLTTTSSSTTTASPTTSSSTTSPTTSTSTSTTSSTSSGSTTTASSTTTSTTSTTASLTTTSTSASTTSSSSPTTSSTSTVSSSTSSSTVATTGTTTTTSSSATSTTSSAPTQYALSTTTTSSTVSTTSTTTTSTPGTTISSTTSASTITTSSTTSSIATSSSSTTTASPTTTSTTISSTSSTTRSASTTSTSSTNSTSLTSSTTSTSTTTSIASTTTTTSTTPSTTTTTPTTPTTTTTTTTTTSTTTLTTTTTTTTTKTAKPTPTTLALSAPYRYLNCYTESIGIRTLSGPTFTSPNMTVPLCAAFCQSHSQPYMGVEYSTECFCGTTINTRYGAQVATDGRCSMPCKGDDSTLCGGPYGVGVYSSSGAPYVGCVADDAAKRALEGPRTASADMTVDKCLGFCGAAWPLVGVEYGTECYCGGGPGTSVTVGASGCGTPCAGDKTQMCGGNWRLSVYNNTAYVPPVLKGNIAGWAYKGCFVDGMPRALFGYVSVSQTAMTQETCVGVCKGRGFTVAGTEYGRECWCGSAVPQTAAKETECSMKCTGDATQSCGGSFRLNVWAA